MAKSSCKCKKAHECEECPEWIFTFADLVMLMMGFFVILWVLKPPAGKQGASDAENAKIQGDWLGTVAAIRTEFGYKPDPHSNDPVDKLSDPAPEASCLLREQGRGGKQSHAAKRQKAPIIK